MTPAVLIGRYRPWLLVCALVAGGCTLQRMQHDTDDALRWLRLEPDAEFRAAGRWQLPRDAAIRVEEVAPGPDPRWLAEAQQGVDSVFSAPSAPPGRSFRLLVAWPPGDGAAPQSGSRWNVVRYLPRFQGPFELQIALVRAGDGVLVEAARIEVTPRWLSRRRAGDGFVRHAFQELASSFEPAY